MKLSPHTTTPFKAQGLAALAGLTLMLGGCTVLEEGKIDYKSATKGASLEVPPDLSQLTKSSRYALESNAASAVAFNNAGGRVSDNGTAANSFGGIKIERLGNQRWLSVPRSADKVWEPLKAFWTANGFTLAVDAPDLGIMETDWAENRAKIPQDGIRQVLGKVLDSLYSSGERDKYRTRLERNAQGGVDIFITHRGMVESYTNADKDQTAWQARASDPELEIEFLRRLMVTLGVSPEAAKTATATETAPATAVMRTVDGQAAIQINDSLDRAWRKTGVALDRNGFTVEDRDRSKGLYFVRYVPQSTGADKNQGFFGQLFSNKKATPDLKRYRISVTQLSDETSLIRLLDDKGDLDASGNAGPILKLLANEMR